MTPTIRCLIVGWGAVSRRMARALDEQPWFALAGIVDPRSEALADAARSHPDTRSFDELSAALSSVTVDAVIVNTPSHLHFEQVAGVLEAGKHVLVAKPITNDFGQAVELVDRALAHGVTLSVGQQMRFMRHYRAVANYIASGQLGSVEMINFLNSKPRPNPNNLATMIYPTLYEMSCHHFDCLSALLPDRRPLSIACDSFLPSWSAYSAGSMVNALIRYTAGLHVLYQAGFAAQGPNYELRVEGSQAALRCRGEHMSIDTMTNELARDGADFVPVDIAEAFPIVDPWVSFADRWHSYLSGGPEPSFSGRNNLAVMALVSAGIESAQQEGAHIEVFGNPRYQRAFDGAATPMAPAGS